MFAVENLHKSFSEKKVLQGCSFSIPDKEIRVLIGRNGVGKSTLLKIITGILYPDSGDVLLNQRSLLRDPTEKRRVGYVPQSSALFPHLTIRDNVAYALKNGRGKEEEIDTILTHLDLHEYEQAYPYQLSGGYRARVALGRALFSNPAIMLLDEPLTEVDHAKKTEMLPEFKKILQELSIPVLYITHDPREAALIGTSFMAMDANGVALVNSAEEAFSFIQ